MPVPDDGRRLCRGGSHGCLDDGSDPGPKRVVIVGGVAGGMSAATRLRRLDADATITVLERPGTSHSPIADCPTSLEA